MQCNNSSLAVNNMSNLTGRQFTQKVYNQLSFHLPIMSQSNKTTCLLANETVAVSRQLLLASQVSAHSTRTAVYIMKETSKVNENGDEIVFEGIRDPTKLICWLVLLYSFVLIGSFCFLLPFIPCLIAFLYCLHFRKWRLYITHSELHYSCGFEYTITPFSDINLISVIPGRKTVLVGINHGLFGGNAITRELRISGVANCKEFVAAAKAEMARSQQQ